MKNLLMKSWTHLWNFFEISALKSFINALPDDISRSVEFHEPDDIDDALRYARQAEEEKVWPVYENYPSQQCHFTQQNHTMLRPGWMNSYNQQNSFNSPRAENNLGYRRNESRNHAQNNFRNYNVTHGNHRSGNYTDKRLYNPNGPPHNNFNRYTNNQVRTIPDQQSIGKRQNQENQSNDLNWEQVRWNSASTNSNQKPRQTEVRFQNQ